MQQPKIRILVVDDYELWRSLFTTTLQKQPDLQVIGELQDGLEAVEQSQLLQPDLVLLDVGLPTLNGIEAARRIREISPASKILFISANRSPEIAEEALRLGAGGYLLKPDAGKDLLPAVRDVLQGKRFVSASLNGHVVRDIPNGHDGGHSRQKTMLHPSGPGAGSHHHEAGFYSDDQSLLHALTQFTGAALRNGDGVIVIATESHRQSLLSRLQAQGLDIDAATEQGSYIALDAAEAIKAVTINGLPDPVRFSQLVGDLIVKAAKSATGEKARVAIYGECGQLMLAEGNAEAAIQLEKLGNRLATTYEADILCGYSRSSVQEAADSCLYDKICELHSAVYSL